MDFDRKFSDQLLATFFQGETSLETSLACGPEIKCEGLAILFVHRFW